MITNKELFVILKEMNIEFVHYKHQPIKNVADGFQYGSNIKGSHCKNLFIKDAKENLYLMITLDKKKIDLKEVASKINSKRLSFASPELLQKYLGVEPGCVTPFGILNDIEKKIVLIIDEEVLNEEEVCFHPLVNTETITIESRDLIRFIEHSGQKKFIISDDN